MNLMRQRTWLLKRAFILPIAVCLFTTPLATAESVPNPAPSTSQWDNARVASVDAGKGTIALIDCPSEVQQKSAVDNCSGSSASPSVSNDLRPQLASLHPGDHVVVHFASATRDSITSVSLRSNQFKPFPRFMAITLAYSALFVLVALVTRGRPLQLIIGTDNRYSNSKFQMALWFSVLISTYIALVVLRVFAFGWDFWGNVEIPTHLFALSGASALTYGAAKGITTSKVQAAQATGQVDPKPAGTPRFLLDLVSNDSARFDLGDFQMLVFTLLAVGMYLVGFFTFLGNIECLRSVQLPDVDTTILAAFGLGQGAYLTKKAGGAPGAS